MKSFLLLAWVAIVLSPCKIYSQRLDFFTRHNSINGNGVEKVPYDETCSFYDLLQDGQSPDSISNGQSFYYVYFRIPYEVIEIGARMMSPSPAYAFAGPGDIVTEAFESTKKRDNYFNPWMALEYGVLADSSGKGPITSWQQLGKNDDNPELMAQPSGKQTNSLIRVFAGPYPAGIYRIKFKSGEKGIPVGSYLLQVGSEPGVKRLKMSRTLISDL